MKGIIIEGNKVTVILSNYIAKGKYIKCGEQFLLRSERDLDNAILYNYRKQIIDEIKK